MANWLALVIGNTRWHWAWFQQDKLQRVWHTSHLTNQQHPALALRSLWANHGPSQILDMAIETLDIVAISVVPNQTQYLARLTNIQWIDKFPLKRVYSTMGLDRVATLWGAGWRYGWPVLVIDGGTALTFTAGTAETFAGGAILLGLRSHLDALHAYTAALPKVEPPSNVPLQWANDTPSAIQSGLIYTVLAGIHHFIQSWQQQYPSTVLIFTGGDGQYLHQLYQQQYQSQQNQALTSRTWFDPNLMFWGISAYRSDETRAL